MPSRNPKTADFKQRLNTVLVYFGLAHPAGDRARPLPGAPRNSRYGLHSSPRLDQDIDALQQRIAELEARLDRSDSR